MIFRHFVSALKARSEVNNGCVTGGGQGRQAQASAVVVRGYEKRPEILESQALNLVEAASVAQGCGTVVSKCLLKIRT